MWGGVMHHHDRNEPEQIAYSDSTKVAKIRGEE